MSLVALTLIFVLVFTKENVLRQKDNPVCLSVVPSVSAYQRTPILRLACSPFPLPYKALYVFNFHLVQKLDWL